MSKGVKVNGVVVLLGAAMVAAAGVAYAVNKKNSGVQYSINRMDEIFPTNRDWTLNGSIPSMVSDHYDPTDKWSIGADEYGLNDKLSLDSALSMSIVN